MNSYKKTDFIRTGNESYLGDHYGGYWTVELKHKERGALIHVLCTPDGNILTAPDRITDRIRVNFRIKDERSKVISINIEGTNLLILKFPAT